MAPSGTRRRIRDRHPQVPAEPRRRQCRRRRTTPARSKIEDLDGAHRRWNIARPRSPFHMPHSPALENFAATLLVFGAPVGSMLVEHRRFRGDAGRRWSDPTYWQLQVWQIAGLLLGILLAKEAQGAALPGNEWLWPVLGCAVGLTGVVLRWWAIWTLGAYFTRNLQIAEDHKVVVDGPYRYLRHPSYTGAILMFAGVGLGLANTLTWQRASCCPRSASSDVFHTRKRCCKRSSASPTSSTPVTRGACYRTSGDLS